MLDGAYYRKRAWEVRTKAIRATFPAIRAQLLSIAKQYDTLAVEADFRAVFCQPPRLCPLLDEQAMPASGEKLTPVKAALAAQAHHSRVYRKRCRAGIATDHRRP